MFLNLQDPSQCNGTVESWHLHYEINNRCGRSKSYSVTFLVYRPLLSSHAMSSLYELVSGSSKSVTLPCHDKSRHRVQLLMEMLSPSERFVIQRDDVVAVCLPGVSSKIKVLNKLDNDKSRSRDSETRETLGPMIYEYHSPKNHHDIDTCVFDSLQTIQPRYMQLIRGSHLHLYANITGIDLLARIL